jgi:hypothetical protein
MSTFSEAPAEDIAMLTRALNGALRVMASGQIVLDVCQLDPDKHRRRLDAEHQADAADAKRDVEWTR